MPKKENSKNRSPKLARKNRYTKKEEAIIDLYLVTSSMDMCMKELMSTDSKVGIEKIFQRLETEYGRLSYALRELRRQFDR